MDLVDLQANADGEYKFIMDYQDHLTKFTVLKPLQSKTAQEVAYNLLDVFCLIGPPVSLQSDNGNDVLKNAKFKSIQQINFCNI